MSNEPKKKERDLCELLSFIANAPEDEEIMAMDCNDHCEQLASLAEQVARGAKLDDILPELQQHMQYWHDCRDEFIALVEVIRSELNDQQAQSTVSEDE